MEELSNEIKSQILDQKEQQWLQRKYSLEMDVKVAELSNDKELLKSIQAQLKTTLIALDVFEKEKTELEK